MSNLQVERQKPWDLNAEKAALLVIDMQNDFVTPGAVMEVPLARTRALPNIKKLIAAARDQRIPVIYTSHVLRDDFPISPLEAAYNPMLFEKGMRDGSDGIEIYADIAPNPNEYVIYKHRYCSFHNTPLENILRTIRGLNVVDTIIITGTVTNVCCETTARSAFMRDFKVVFVDDACGGLDEASHEATCKIIGQVFGRVLTTEETLAEIGAVAVSAP